MSIFFVASTIRPALLARIAKQHLRKPIDHLWLASTGGDAYTALGIYDLLKGIPDATTTGFCFSAATLILLAGEHRLASANTRFLIHAPHHGKHKPSPALAQERTVLQERISSIYCERTGMSPAMAEHLLSKDSYFGVDEALEFGLIHEIWGPK